MEITGQLQGPAALQLGKNAGSNLTEGWVALTSVWTFRRRKKPFPLAGFELRPCNPVPSRYTDHTIPDPNNFINF
jgi:hypothetical protein